MGAGMEKKKKRAWAKRDLHMVPKASKALWQATKWKVFWFSDRHMNMFNESNMEQKMAF